MPELPEVESLKQSLEPYILNKEISKIQIKLPKIISGKGNKRQVSQQKADLFQKQVVGKKITKLYRRAKNLIFFLEDNSLLLIHLKMTGQLVYKSNKQSSKNLIAGGHPIQLSEETLPHKHTHLIFKLIDPQSVHDQSTAGYLYYNDVRQFGYILHYPNLGILESEGHFNCLGLEPLEADFTLDAFDKKLQTKKGVLKKVLLDQSVVVGLGNIYADEVCFSAGVRPDRKVQSLTKKEVKCLYCAIKKIIPRAVHLGGSSVANYLLADGSRGNYAREHMVYGRHGQPCKVCDSTLKKISLAGRTTVYCQKCQQ